MLIHFHYYTGVCEASYRGPNCDKCDTGYYGDGNMCTYCGTHKTTPTNSTALSVSDCMYPLIQLR